MSENTLQLVRRLPVTKKLSVKECVVLELLAHGNTNKQIARKLQSSINTIKAQVRSIYFKLNADDRAHAVFVACLLEILTIENYDEKLLLP